MTDQYDQFIAGGGIGGMLSAALLSQSGKKVFLAEKLPFLGGRFTTHNFKGYEIPTGAVHMVPHGIRGPLGKLLLNELKLPLQIHDVENFTAWYWPDRKPIRHKNFWGIFKAFPKFSQRIFILRKLLPGARHSDDYQEPFHDYLEERTQDPQIFQFFNAITGFALSLDITEISTAAMYRFFRRLYQGGRPGVPIGGCKAVIKALTTQSRQNGAILKNKYELKALEINGGNIETAICYDLRSNEEIEIRAKEFILNLGHPQVNKVLSASKLKYRLSTAPVARGGGFVFRSEESILGSSAVAQFPEHKFVKGAVEPTIISPELAPKGEHLLVTHFILHSDDISKDLRHAREEFLETFPQLNEEDELCVHTFQKDWPVNYAVQGRDIPNFSDEISNLYFVGDSYKGNNGWFMAEGVAHGAKLVVNKILNKSKENNVI